MHRFRRYLAFFIIFYLTLVLLFVIQNSPLPSLPGFLPESIIKIHPSNDFQIVGSQEKLSFKYATYLDSTEPSKLILMLYGPEEIGQSNLAGCPDYNCRITHDYRLINQSSAVVFLHGASDRIPPVRFDWQYYVFFTQESPIHIQPLQPYKNFFNLTLSYRRDSDAPSPYGYALKRPKPKFDWKHNLNPVIVGKTKQVAWFVSHCGAPSKRDAYVDQLKKYIPVDIYGGCGTLTCSRMGSKLNNKNKTRFWSDYDENEDTEFDNDKDNCDRMLERDYKFYLAFENSICKDYVTEKFWQKLTLRIVVIVLKRSIIEQSAPPGSFIAADDFQSPVHLANYLKGLSEDPIEYERRFDWRINYRPVFLNGHIHDVRERPWGFCKLCNIINQNRSRKYYPDVNEWWIKRAKCDNNLVMRMLTSR